MTLTDWSPLLEILGSSSRTLLVSHVAPDADTLGSSLALALALRAQAVDVTVSVGEPGFTVPRGLAWLPGADTVVAPDHLTQRFDAVIALDCASEDRLGTLLPLARSVGARFAVVDHHRSNIGFGAVNVIDADAPATGTMIAELLDAGDLPWAPGVAENIYAAIASDTGGFRFPATTSHTHRLAAQLLDMGVDHYAIAQRLFSSRPLPVVRLSAEVIAAAQYEPETAHGAGAIFATLSSADRHRHDVAYDDVESIIGDLAAIADVDVVALAKQDDQGVWKVSMRSKGTTDVGRVATSLGGGGHRQAAGFTSSEPTKEAALTQVRSALAEPLNQRR